jgi:hypothetical protein
VINATLFLKAYSSLRLQILHWQDPVEAQKRQLLYNINKAKNTKFGKDHDFTSIRSIEEYQTAVPLRTYEQFWNNYFKPEFPKITNITWPGTIPFFAVSSGTSSGTTKYIPYTHEMTASNTKAGIDLLVHHLKNKPSSQILAGKSFMLGGSTSLLEQSPGIFSGDLSGIAVKTMHSWVRPWYFPPPELALIENWEEKIDVLGKRSFEEDIRMLGGVPTWLLIYFDKLKSLKPQSQGRIKELLPNLEMLVHGGVPFGPYLDRFNQIFKGSNVDFREVYPASEAFIALADRGLGQGLRLLCDHGNFFEFVPADELESAQQTGSQPRRHWLANVEIGVNYAIVLSNCAGLWSYVLGDTVQFVETSPPRLLVTGRTAFYLSAFGEHVIADEIEDAVSFASQVSGISIEEYTVGALFPKKEGDLGQHLFIVESESSTARPESANQFCEAVDHRLSDRNEDYRAHRAGGFGLKIPALRIVPKGTFMAWMKARGKLGGQNKIPRIIARTELFDDLRAFLEQ